MHEWNCTLRTNGKRRKLLRSTSDNFTLIIFAHKLKHHVFLFKSLEFSSMEGGQEDESYDNKPLEVMILERSKLLQASYLFWSLTFVVKYSVIMPISCYLQLITQDVHRDSKKWPNKTKLVRFYYFCYSKLRYELKI